MVRDTGTTNINFALGGLTLEAMKRVLETQPLLEVNASKQGLEGVILPNDTNIYFGTGICSHKDLSKGTPFDILSMILTAASLRKKFGFRKIFHNIADSHALTNKFPEESVEVMTKHYKETVNKVKRVLNIEDYEILRASEFDKEEEYKEISNMVENKPELTSLHSYAKREIADVEFFRRKGAMLKIGWTMSIPDSQFDESFYDRIFHKYVNPNVGFVYIVPGRSFDKSKPRVAPYVDFNPTMRIMIPDDDVSTKIKRAEAELGKAFKSITRYYFDLFKLWREFDPGLPQDVTLTEGIQYILNKLR
ncbi:MAG: hypothetical protein ACPLXS_03200 [Candidatus Micrarchaeales archaeon]